MKNFLTIILLLLPLHGFSQDRLLTDWANVRKYANENETIKTRSPSEPRVVFMGNSITEAWKIIDSSFFAGRGYINRGISGQTSPQMLVRFRPDVIALKPSVVVILCGTNDIAENTGPISLAGILGNIISMSQLARVNGIRVVLSSVLPAYDFRWRPGLEPAEKIFKLNTMIKGLCEENNITYVDYYTEMVDERKGMDKKFTIDGVHPTLAGYKIMEPLVEEAIAKALEQGTK